MITLKRINKALSDRGYKLELIKGKGYFYFIGEDTINCFSTSVMVNKLSDLPFDSWIKYAFILYTTNKKHLTS